MSSSFDLEKVTTKDILILLMRQYLSLADILAFSSTCKFLSSFYRRVIIWRSARHTPSNLLAISADNKWYSTTVQSYKSWTEFFRLRELEELPSSCGPAIRAMDGHYGWCEGKIAPIVDGIGNKYCLLSLENRVEFCISTRQSDVQAETIMSLVSINWVPVGGAWLFSHSTNQHQNRLILYTQALRSFAEISSPSLVENLATVAKDLLAYLCQIRITQNTKVKHYGDFSERVEALIPCTS